jgi:hypothetical protein
VEPAAVNEDVGDGGEERHGAETYGGLCFGEQAREGCGGEAEIIDDEEERAVA